MFQLVQIGRFLIRGGSNEVEGGSVAFHVECHSVVSLGSRLCLVVVPKVRVLTAW